MPTLARDRLAGAYVYYDAQADDARLTLTIARTAAVHGAAIANYAAVRGIVKDGDRVVGARVEADGEEIVVRARAVVNAAGRVGRRRARARRGRTPGVDPSGQGHPHHGAVVQGAQRHRRHRARAATTGDRCSSCRGATPRTSARPTPTTTARSTTRRAPPTTSTTCSARSTASPTTSSPTPTSSAPGPGCGRSCARGATSRTADLSRRHSVRTAPSGVVTVTGGKLTTYRRMAADAVDAALDVLGEAATTLAHEAPAPVRRRGHRPAGRRARTQRARAPDRPLRHRRRGRASRWSTTNPSSAHRSCPACRTSRAEAPVRGAPRDGPHPRRRPHAAARGPGCSRATRRPRPASDVAALLAPELGWSDAERDAQVAAYRASIAAERGDGP